MRATLTSFALCLSLAASVAGCCSAQCDPEKVPHRNVAASEKDLVDIVQHLAKYECWSELYDHLSDVTKDKFSRLQWRIGASSIKLPPPYEYRVVDVAEKGTYIESIENPTNPREAIAYIDYEEPGKPRVRLKLLVLKQAMPLGDGGPMPDSDWRVAFWDQELKVEAGDGRYWWYDKGG